MNNVIKISSKNTPVIYQDDEIIPSLRNELMKYLRSGGKFSELSNKCGGYPTATTISRICYGDSRFPRFWSVYKIFKALEFNVSVYKK